MAFDTAPRRFVVRSSVRSWCTTTTPSRERRTSSSEAVGARGHAVVERREGVFRRERRAAAVGEHQRTPRLEERMSHTRQSNLDRIDGMADHIQTLGDLRKQRGTGSRPVRAGNSRQPRAEAAGRERSLFPGIIGYDDTVIPQLVNAILSRHNFILLGLRGQAKSRILRGLVDLLDEQIPVVPGCEIHDDPLAPICGACRARIAKEGDAMPIGWLPREAATSRSWRRPTSTIADMVGDIDPDQGARRRA